MANDEKASEEWTRPRVREVATGLLGRRGHARRELFRKLRERDVPELLAQEICEDLADEGVLDDVEFARHQGAILRDKNWGPRQIRRKLEERGVESEAIDIAIEEIGGAEGWLGKCYERLTSRFHADIAGFSQREKEKAYRHLTHRGYRPSTVRRILFDGATPADAGDGQD